MTNLKTKLTGYNKIETKLTERQNFNADPL